MLKHNKRLTLFLTPQKKRHTKHQNTPERQTVSACLYVVPRQKKGEQTETDKRKAELIKKILRLGGEKEFLEFLVQEKAKRAADKRSGLLL